MLKVLSSLEMWKFLPKNYFTVMPLKAGLKSKARMVNLTVNSNLRSFICKFTYFLGTKLSKDLQIARGIPIRHLQKRNQNSEAK